MMRIVRDWSSFHIFFISFQLLFSTINFIVFINFIVHINFIVYMLSFVWNFVYALVTEQIIMLKCILSYPFYSIQVFMCDSCDVFTLDWRKMYTAQWFNILWADWEVHCFVNQMSGKAQRLLRDSGVSMEINWVEGKKCNEIRELSYANYGRIVARLNPHSRGDALYIVCLPLLGLRPHRVACYT